MQHAGHALQELGAEARYLLRPRFQDEAADHDTLRAPGNVQEQQLIGAPRRRRRHGGYEHGAARPGVARQAADGLRLVRLYLCRSPEPPVRRVARRRRVREGPARPGGIASATPRRVRAGPAALERRRGKLRQRGLEMAWGFARTAGCCKMHGLLPIHVPPGARAGARTRTGPPLR